MSAYYPPSFLYLFLFIILYFPSNDKFFSKFLLKTHRIKITPPNPADFRS